MSRQQTRSDSVSRRKVLGAVGAAGAVSVAGCGILSDDDDGDEETAPTLGINVPQEGRWADEGKLLRAGYLLATQHLNDPDGPMVADGEYEPPLGEMEGGLLGETVELEVRNTASTTDGARQSAEGLAADDVVMLAGGGSPAEGLGMQAVAAEEQLLYMSGFTPTNRLGGADCSRYGFTEMHNPRMATDALLSVVPDRLEENRDTFAQVYPDNEFGEEIRGVIENRFSDQSRFRQNVAVSAQVGAGSYTGVLADVLDTGVSVVVLNFTGLDGAIALQDLADLVAERGREDVQAIVPIMTRELLRNAGEDLVITGNEVLGTVPWTPDLDDPFTNRFLDSWAEADISVDLEVPEVPSALSHLAYVQLYQYAAAVERAGSFDAEAVIEELEGQEYDFGAGQAEMRACDHQSMRPVPVVEGRPRTAQEPGNYTNLVGAVDVGYSCDEGPAADCEL